MSTETDDPVAERLQRYWQKALDDLLLDARKEGCDAENIAKISPAMLDVAVAKYAEQNGARRTSDELDLVSQKFRQAGDREAGGLN